MAGFNCLVNYGLVALHNDRRLTLRQFGERQRRGAMTAVLLARKYPERYRDVPLLRENETIDSRDSFRIVAKKLAKSALSTRPGMASLFAITSVLERLAPNARVLQRIYWVITGVYIFRGVREGEARYSLRRRQEAMGVKDVVTRIVYRLPVARSLAGARARRRNQGLAAARIMERSALLEFWQQDRPEGNVPEDYTEPLDRSRVLALMVGGLPKNARISRAGLQRRPQPCLPRQ